MPRHARLGLATRSRRAAIRLLIARVSPCATRLRSAPDRESPLHGPWPTSGPGARRRAPRMAATRMRPPYSGRALQIRNISNLSARTMPAMHHGGEIIRARPESDAR
ncbi:hypothetical protein C6P77_14890 [Burkholderia ambifaria]|nr:hypothetical protein C6P77_14890 [Burkholderia ambifaria]